MAKLTTLFLLIVAIAAPTRQQLPASLPPGNAPITGPFTDQELQQFAALAPIDTHTHIYQTSPAFLALLNRLNLHVLDILVAHSPDQKALDTESAQAWEFVRASGGRASLCTTFNPFGYGQHDFAQSATAAIDHDFDQGAVAVKIWKNIGEQVKDAQGHYILPDDPALEPIYKDIVRHNKTLVAHVADPNTIWEPPNPSAPDYSYYMHHPEWYMYNKPNIPSKALILDARDRLLEVNRNLRVVGAHLGSMEADFNQLSTHLDRYPNFAVDLAARMPYLVMQPRPKVILFIEKYQDRLIYATDNELPSEAKAQAVTGLWERTYAFDWRFFATNDTLQYNGHKVQGLALPTPILRKLYHDNAVKWFPGILPAFH